MLMLKTLCRKFGPQQVPRPATDTGIVSEFVVHRKTCDLVLANSYPVI